MSNRKTALDMSITDRSSWFEWEKTSSDSENYTYICTVNPKELIEVCWSETVELAEKKYTEIFYNSSNTSIQKQFAHKITRIGKNRLTVIREKEHSSGYFNKDSQMFMVNVAYLGSLCTTIDNYFQCSDFLLGCSNLKDIQSNNIPIYKNNFNLPTSIDKTIKFGYYVPSEYNKKILFSNPAGYESGLTKLNGKMLTVEHKGTTSYQYTNIPEGKIIKDTIFFIFQTNGTGSTSTYDFSIDENFLLTIKYETAKSNEDGYNYYTVAVKIIYTDGTFDTDYFTAQLSDSYEPCLVEGTKITLYDGSQKNIEDIQYNDLLLVWNFDIGAYDYQYPFFIKNADVTNKIVRLILDNGEYLDVALWHEIYNVSRNRFFIVNYYEEDKLKEEIEDFVVMLHKPGAQPGCSEFITAKVIDYQIINEKKKYFTLLTGRTQTSFANGILVGSKDLNYTNIKDNQWDLQLFDYIEKNNMQISHEEYCKEFGNIEKHLFYGALYDYFVPGAKHLVQLDYDWDAGMKQSVKNYWSNCKTHPILKDYNENIHNAWYCCYIKDNKIVNGGYFIEGKEITLPPLNDGLWYSVGHGKTFKPGEKVVIHYGNVFRSVKE